MTIKMHFELVLECLRASLKKVRSSRTRRYIESQVTGSALVRVCAAVNRAAHCTLEEATVHLRWIAGDESLALRPLPFRLNDEWQKSELLLALTSSGTSTLILTRVRSGWAAYEPVSNQVKPISRDSPYDVLSIAYLPYRVFPVTPLSWTDLGRFAAIEFKRDWKWIVIEAAATSALALIAPLVTAFIFQQVIPSGRSEALVPTTAILIASLLMTTMLSALRETHLEQVNAKLDRAFAAAIWHRVLSLPLTAFADRSGSDLALRVLDLVALRQSVMSMVLSVLSFGGIAAVSWIYLLYLSWQTAAVAGLVAMCAAVVLGKCCWAQSRIAYEIADASARAVSCCVRILRGLFTIENFNARVPAFRSWVEYAGKKLDVQARADRINSVLNTVIAVVPGAGLAVMLTTFEVAVRRASPVIAAGSNLPAVIVAFLQLLSSLVMLGAASVNIGLATTQYSRLRPLLEAIPNEMGGGRRRITLRGALAVRELRFRYPQRFEDALKGLSFDIARGELVAFVGPSGSGKSTLCRILLGLEDKWSGSVELDGDKLERVDLHNLRSQLGVVLQNTRVLPGTIFSNLIDAGPISEQDAWRALNLAEFQADVRKMPMGLHTRVGEGGVGLSNGQQQRLLLARALARRPRMLLLDEATSALDGDTQAKVMNNLEELKITRIIVAHRLSTVRRADRIYVMRQGRIEQSGTFEELMIMGGLFQALLEAS